MPSVKVIQFKAEAFHKSVHACKCLANAVSEVLSYFGRKGFVAFACFFKSFLFAEGDLFEFSEGNLSADPWNEYSEG